MASYDTLTISASISPTAAAPDDLLRLTAPDSSMLVGSMDAFDHDLNFNAEGLLSVLLPVSLSIIF